MLNRRGFVVGAAAMLCAAHARAQGADDVARYPERPIKLIVPFAPGGVYDAFARPWTEAMKPLLGTIVIENIGGGGGINGAANAARATPDGYTLFLGGGGSHIINPVASRKLPYDPIADFAPICVTTLTGLAIAAHPSVPATTLAELIAYAKANPNRLSYGSAGTGSATHLGGELFKSLIGVPGIAHVPYRGSGQTIVDLVGGQIPLSFPNVTGQILDLHRNGKIRVLAVTTPRRLRGAPDLPTAEEAGLPGMIAQNFTALFAPAGTPAGLIEKVRVATRAVLISEAFQKYMIASGFESSDDDTPEKTRAFIASEFARWKPVIESVGLRNG